MLLLVAAAVRRRQHLGLSVLNRAAVALSVARRRRVLAGVAAAADVHVIVPLSASTQMMIGLAAADAQSKLQLQGENVFRVSRLYLIIGRNCRNRQNFLFK
jgi:hypothetical protein